MARSRSYQAVTKDSTKLLIGLMQVRISNLYPHSASATAQRTDGYALQSAAMPVTPTFSGTYSGSKVGTYTVEITGSGATFAWTDPEGNITTGVAMATDPTLLEDGISVAWSAATGGTVGQKWVCGVQPPGTSSAIQVDTLATKSYLDSSHSIGALQSAQLSADITTKEHSSGYPAVIDLVITESSNINVEVNMEEFGNTTNKPILDALFEAINSGQVYACSVECIGQFANGDVKSFWLPNCNLVPNLNINPGNDWAGTPIKFKAVAQTGVAYASMKLIYMNDYAND